MDCGNDGWVCEVLSTAGVRGLRIAAIVVVGFVVARAGTRLAARSVESLGARAPLAETSPRAQLRAKTLSGVVASGVRVVVWAVVVLIVLDELGVNLGPILAGASIAGVAIGFGSQTLVRDFVSGFFVLVEDQFGVDDVVTIGDTTGTVEEVNLRVTRLRAADGTVWYIPNGEIRKVGNAAKDWSKALVDVPLPAKSDLARATASIVDEVRALAADAQWSGALLEEPEVLGVEDLGTDGPTVRVAAKTSPAQRSRVARELRARIASRLQRDGIDAVPAGSGTDSEAPGGVSD